MHFSKSAAFPSRLILLSVFFYNASPLLIASELKFKVLSKGMTSSATL